MHSTKGDHADVLSVLVFSFRFFSLRGSFHRSFHGLFAIGPLGEILGLAEGDAPSSSTEFLQLTQYFGSQLADSLSFASMASASLEHVFPHVSTRNYQ